MLKKILEFFKSLFEKKPAVVIEFPAHRRVPAPARPSTDNDALTSDWTLKALRIIAKFESHDGEPQVTGNFDGSGLTCGWLGYTLRWGNQREIVKAFAARFGSATGLHYMPRFWKYYLELQALDVSEAIASAAAWSDGPAVKEPLRTELLTFWRSPEMQLLQVDFARKDFGNWAMRMSENTRAYFGRESVRFRDFVYWFDWAVLNGKSFSNKFFDAKNFSLQDVWDWMSTEHGAAIKDFRNNLETWKMLDAKGEIDNEEALLLKVAMLRARQANANYDTVTMNRRGTLAVGRGWVNGEFRVFEF